MIKSFISILGTNNYLECMHSFNGKSISEQPVKYVQEDLIKFFCKDFDEDSEIRILLTKDAKVKNWYSSRDRDNYNKGLKERLSELGIKAKVKTIDINEGFSETEIWNNFQNIYETISEYEEVIVDITHSFRSLPMLLITLLNYAKQLKKIKVLGIYYAAFEILGPIQEVNKVEPQHRIAPILDLTSFSELQDWTNATYDFVNNANINQIKQLVKLSNKNSPINDPKDKFFPSKVVDHLEKLISNIALCRGNELLKYDYTKLKENINLLKDNSNLPAAFKYLIDEIQNKIKSFNNDLSQLTLSVVEWCLQHNLIQQAITFLQEFTIALILNDIKKEDGSDKTNRDLVSQAFIIKSTNTKEENWFLPAREKKEVMRELLNNRYIEKLMFDYNSLTDLRNDVNHAGFKADSKNAESIKARLNNIIESYKSIVQDLAIVQKM